MFRLFFRKPHLFFLGLGLLTLVVAVSYFRYEPEAYFDLSGDQTFTVSSAICWLVFSGYTFILAAIYFIANKGNLRTYRWLVLTHFIFGLLFLLLFAVFSSLNTQYVQDRLSGIPVLTMVLIYGVFFVLDFVMFMIGLALLVINILLIKKEKP